MFGKGVKLVGWLHVKGEISIWMSLYKSVCRDKLGLKFLDLILRIISKTISAGWFYLPCSGDWIHLCSGIHGFHTNHRLAHFSPNSWTYYLPLSLGCVLWRLKTLLSVIRHGQITVLLSFTIISAGVDQFELLTPDVWWIMVVSWKHHTFWGI